MRLQTVVMTPKRATEILNDHEKLEIDDGRLQRPLTAKNVAKIAALIGTPHWSPSNTDIQISARGRILNGQHTLTAIAKTGLSAPVILKTEIPVEDEKKVYATCDTYKKRSAPDVLSTAGHEHDRGMVSTLSGWIRAYIKTGKFVPSPPLIDIQDIADEYREIVEEAIVFSKDYTLRYWGEDNRPKLKNHFALWHALMIIRKVPDFEIDEFFASLLNRAAPELEGYRTFLAKHSGLGGAKSQELTTTIYKAWEYYWKGTPTKGTRSFAVNYNDLRDLSFDHDE